jgi:hypothetical protein
VDHTQRVMRVLVHGPEAREVLDRGGHPGRLEAADHRRPMPGDGGRVVPERADAHRHVAGLGCEVEDRGVDDVDAQRPSLAADRGPDPLGQAFVVDRPERHVPGELRRLGAEGIELATLLVGGDEEGAVGAVAGRRSAPGRRARHGRRATTSRRPSHARPLHCLGQLPNLRRPHDVDRHEQRDARGRRLRQTLREPTRDPLAFEGEHHPFEDPIVGHPLTAPARPRTK